MTCTLLDGSGYAVLAAISSATVPIKDDDPTIVSLARVGSGAVEEGEAVEFTVTLSRALVGNDNEIIEVPLSISGIGVTTADWSLAKKSGTGLNTGVELSRTTTASPLVEFRGRGSAHGDAGADAGERRRGGGHGDLHRRARPRRHGRERLRRA